MKRLVIIAICCLMAFPVFAGELDGKTFQIDIKGTEYRLTFTMGPFSPGESGTVLLEDDNGMEICFHYRYYNGIGDLDGLPIFLRDNRLLIFDGDPMELKEVSK